jgi:hypothetical protein
LLQHFELHGLNEGRASSPDYNVSYYRFNNSDLVAADFNYKQAYEHFVLHGYNEGRLGVAPPIQQWRQEFGSPTADRSNDVAVDSAGNVYITGVTDGSLAGNNAGGIDAWVAKYNNSGDRLWIQQFGTSNADTADNIAVDSAGNVYITGETNGSLGGTNAGNQDTWLAKYNTRGNLLWIQQFGTANNDSSTDIAVDSADNIYITGVIDQFFIDNPRDTDAWLAKYDTSGNRQWLQQLNTPGDDAYTAVATDSASNVYITGYTDLDAFFAKYDSSGSRLWIQQSSSNLYNDVAVDSADNIYVTTAEDNNGLLTKYDSSGKRLWTQNQSGRDLAVDNAGSVYMITGSTSVRGTISTSVSKYDASSGYRLGIQYSASEQFNPPISGLAVDNASNFYLTGRFFNFAGETISEDAWVAKFSQPLNLV